MTHTRCLLEGRISGIFTGATLLGFVASWLPGQALADQYHSNNFLLGARAQGLGGAFTAIADDASGVFYNPGGTAFARGSDLSLSAATFYQRKTNYDRVYGEGDFQERARGAVSTFLGGLLRPGPAAAPPRFTFGFALYTPDAGLVDENTTVIDEPAAGLLRYHRMQSQRSTSLHAAASLAAGIGSVMGIGVSAGYFDVDELTLTAQDVEQGPYTFEDQGLTSVRSITSEHARESLHLSGVTLGAGARIDPAPFLSVGVSLRLIRILRQQLQRDREEVSAWIGASGKPVVASTGAKDSRFDGAIKRSHDSKNDDTMFETLPTEVRAGISLRPWMPLTWTFDAAHHTKSIAKEGAYARAATTNLHTGLELVWFSRFVTRAGGFTNFDATRSRDVLSLNGRGEYVDYLGASGGLALRVKRSEYGATYVQQWGKGQAEKSPGVVSQVDSRFQLFTLSASQAL